MEKIGLFLLLAVGLVGFVPRLAGQEPAKDTEPAKRKGIVLTDEKLAEMLEGLGYETKQTRTSTGRLTCTFTMTVDAWEFKPSFELSEDKSVLWLVVGLQKLPDPARPPGEILLRLLKENEKDTKFFSVSVTTNIIRLSMPIPNHDVTPASLRRCLEQFKRRIGQTEELWNPKKWPADPKP